jgi:O-antigen/teichoic acid export membrane protein
MFFMQLTNLVSQLLMLPILINHAETAAVGAYFLVLSFSSLAGIFVNFGTNQATIIELQRANMDGDRNRLAKIYANSFAIRLIPMVLCVVVALLLGITHTFGHFFLLSLILIIAEFLSPLFYLIALQKMRYYVLFNFLFKLIAFAFIWICRNETGLVGLAIILPGISMILLNILMLMMLRRRDGMPIKFQFNSVTFQTMKVQAPVVANNMTVHLQQSVFLFSISSVASPVFLSAYGFIDKVVGSIRLVVSSYNASFIPIATSAHHTGFGNWKTLRNKHNRVITILSLITAAVLFFFSEELVSLFLLGGKENSAVFIALSGQLLRMISLVPLLIALNALNIMELLMENRFNDYLMAGMIVLLFSASGAVFTRLGLQQRYLGFYPFYIEAVSLLIYLFFVLRNRKNHI